MSEANATFWEGGTAHKAKPGILMRGELRGRVLTIRNDNEMLNLTGVVENIIFQNAENGYAVCELSGGDILTTVTGYLPGIAAGENITVHGEWKQHHEYGEQFEAQYFERTQPKAQSDIEKYLASGIIPGVGKTIAKRIVATFGAQSLDIIENEHTRLVEIRGITEAKAQDIHKKYLEHIGMRDVIMYFSKLGVPLSYAVRAYKAFGMSAASVIERNPYIMTEDLIGVNFSKADEIAQSLGWNKSAYERISSGIKYLMAQLGFLNGHSFLPRETVVGRAAGFLEVEREKVEEAVSKMLISGRLVAEDMGEFEVLYTEAFYEAERNVANRLIEMSGVVFDTAVRDAKPIIEQVQHEIDIELDEMQLEAVEMVLSCAATVITGGPGTGKTTIINTIIKLMDKLGKKVMLAAPTGRAAKRMTEVCGVEAKTIHRLLEVAPGGGEEVGNIFARNEEKPLECDILIVDEMSMVDILLMDSLLKAVPRGARLVMVGDADQLPSVGAGNVLKDIIESDSVNSIKLTEIFRQAKESMIVVNAHSINNGSEIMFNDNDNDFFLFCFYSAFDTINTIADLCAVRLPKAYEFDPLSQIQVITPTRRDEVGVPNLNYILQNRLNPKSDEKAEHKSLGRTFRVGDKVMQTRNNYKLEWKKLDGSDEGQGVFNGDVGYITDIDNRGGALTVLYDDRLVTYDFILLDEIDLAYAMTVHKSQGSEFDAVVMPMVEVHRLLMTRNLLYTAVTRARRLVVLVGQEDVVNFYIANDSVKQRFSGLKQKLMTF